MKIKILPRELTEKIAAGEVVERPASVIKELMENALDAGATRLVVAVGPEVVDYLEVFDNGIGMLPEEVSLALQRHATSKIASDDDLYNISTLGFRGEALPSIAAVSDLRIETRVEESPFGACIHAGGEGRNQVKEIGMSRGTRIIVKGLFSKIPARLKFLRSKQTETGHIIDTFTRLALSRLDVSFQLVRAEKIILNAPAADDLQQRVSQLFGWQFAEGLRSLSGQNDAYRMDGLISPPDRHKLGPRGIFLFINHRPVRNVQIQKMIREAYQGLLPKGRFPIAILSFNVPPSELDVNVHPTKMEVAFARPQQIQNLIQNNLSRAIYQTPWNTPARPVIEVTDNGVAQKEAEGGAEGAHPKPQPYENYQSGRCEPIRESYEPDVPVKPAAPVYNKNLFDKEDRFFRSSEPLFTQGKIIGQFRGSYLICEYNDNLVLIDQHAAHERIVYEKLEEAYKKNGVTSQVLLVPEVMELPQREADCLKRHLEKLINYGLEVDFYGGTSFVIKAVSELLLDTDPRALLQDIAEELVELEQTKQLGALHSHVFARMACHSVIRAGYSMEWPEMEALLKELDSKPDLLSCPHGRPIMIAWSLKEIEKRFRRI